MSVQEIHENDIGTIFRVTLKDGSTVLDISGATTKQIFLKPIGGSIQTKTASFTTTGVDGKLQYTTVAGDLTPAGTWEIQARVVFTTGEWRSSIKRFIVHPNLT